MQSNGANICLQCLGQFIHGQNRPNLGRDLIFAKGERYHICAPLQSLEPHLLMCKRCGAWRTKLQVRKLVSENGAEMLSRCDLDVNPPGLFRDKGPEARNGLSLTLKAQSCWAYASNRCQLRPDNFCMPRALAISYC